MSPQKKKKKKSKEDKNKDENDQEKQKKAEEENTKLDPYPLRAYNKLEDNYHLSNKKALFINMKNYYEARGEQPFDALPITFHIKTGLDDPEYLKFSNFYKAHIKDKHNIWIIKPGECTN